MSVGVINRSNKRVGERPHGSYAKYVLEKCRCEECRKGSSQHRRQRYRLQAMGEYRLLVDAKRSKNRLHSLQCRGLSRRDIAQIAGMSPTTLWKIATGKRTRVTPETERRLLAIDELTNDIDANRVPADESWETIYRIMECGYSKAVIARHLGCRAPAIRLSHDRIYKSTADKIAQLYQFARANPAPYSQSSVRAKNYAKRALHACDSKLKMRELYRQKGGGE